jgi:hypothetical protein
VITGYNLEQAYMHFQIYSSDLASPVGVAGFAANKFLAQRAILF